MQCERAQEFFSEYLERTLDRPMTVALESHLGSCSRCREEVECLQETLLTLDTVPEVEPPWDGAWQVMARIRTARAEQLEAQRPKSLTFFQWLRSISPAGMALSAGLATLVVAGTAVIPEVRDTLKLLILPAAPAPRAVPAPAPEMPAVQATYQAGLREIGLTITPTSELPAADLIWEMEGGVQERRGGFGLSANQPHRLPVVLPATGRDADTVRMTIASPLRGKEYHYLIVVSQAQRGNQRVTLLLENRPLEEALRQLAPYLDRPVVVAGATESSVSLNVAGKNAAACLDDVARQIGARVDHDGPAYRLLPAL